VKALGLKEGDVMSVTFNDVVKIEPMKKERENVGEDA
jgi:hypothetical protein